MLDFIWCYRIKSSCLQRLSDEVMNRDILRNIIQEGQDALTDISLYIRPICFEDEGRYVLTGIRQAGKSYMLYQRALYLISKGFDRRDMVFINFDDERLLGTKVSDLDLILQVFSSMSEHSPILFFDEIQNVEGWEHFARRLANQKYRVTITGSNARMLSRDIATTLGGRYIDVTIWPYSFREYLGATGVLTTENLEDLRWDLGKKRDEIRRSMASYFRWGGFPELLLIPNSRRQWLNSLYNKILLGDIVQRNKIRNETAVRFTVKRIAESIGQPVSYNRLSNLIKSVGLNTSAASVMEYVGYVKDACILFSLDNFASKFSEREAVKKYYFTDNGLLNIFLTGGDASLLENMCAIALKAKYGDRVYFYNHRIEVDFLVPEEGLAVQSSYSVSDDDTLSREVAGLRKLNAINPLRRMLIVTYEDETTIELGDGRKIEVLPLYKWLINNF